MPFFLPLSSSLRQPEDDGGEFLFGDLLNRFTMLWDTYQHINLVIVV